MAEVTELESTDVKEESKRSRRLTLSDSYWLAILTASVYLFAYKLDVAYLKYFGIDDVFSDVTTKKILFAGSGLIAFITFIWNTAGFLPPEFYKYLKNAIIPFVIEIFLASIAAIIFFATGVSWWVVVPSIICILLLFYHVLSIRRFLKGGGTFQGYVDRVIRDEVQVQDQMIRNVIVDRFGNSLLIVVILIVVSPALGGVFGQRLAAARVDFSTIIVGSELYIVVSEFQGSLLAAGLVDSVPRDEYTLSGEVKVFPLVGESNSTMRSERFKHGKATSEPKLLRTTFGEFWRGNFGFLKEDGVKSEQ